MYSFSLCLYFNAWFYYFDSNNFFYILYMRRLAEHGHVPRAYGQSQTQTPSMAAWLCVCALRCVMVCIYWVQKVVRHSDQANTANGGGTARRQRRRRAVDSGSQHYSSCLCTYVLVSYVNAGPVVFYMSARLLHARYVTMRAFWNRKIIQLE